MTANGSFEVSWQGKTYTIPATDLTFETDDTEERAEGTATTYTAEAIIDSMPGGDDDRGTDNRRFLEINVSVVEYPVGTFNDTAFEFDDDDAALVSNALTVHFNQDPNLGEMPPTQILGPSF